MTDKPPRKRLPLGRLIVWRVLPWVPAAALLVLFVVRACSGAAEPVARGGSSSSASSPVPVASSSTARTKTTDTMRAVTSPAAPLLTGLGPKRGAAVRGAAVVVRAGELVMPLERAVPRGRWEGTVDGQPASRRGARLAVRRAAGESSYLMFASDLGPAKEIRSAATICAMLRQRTQVSDDETCAKKLRRVRLPTGLLAYLPCAGGCPLAVLREGHLSITLIDDILDASPMNGGAVLAVNTRYARHGGTLTGGTLVLVALDGPVPAVEARIELDRVDSRHPAKITSRTGTLQLGSDTIRFTGEQRTVERDTARVLLSKPIDERYRVGADGHTVPSSKPRMR